MVRLEVERANELQPSKFPIDGTFSYNSYDICFLRIPLSKCLTFLYADPKSLTSNI